MLKLEVAAFVGKGFVCSEEGDQSCDIFVAWYEDIYVVCWSLAPQK
jgi:hypothetical protein